VFSSCDDGRRSFSSCAPLYRYCATLYSRAPLISHPPHILSHHLFHHQQAIVDDSNNGSKQTFNLMLADNTIYEMEDIDEELEVW
jgi:hypothetical protein